MPPNLETSKIEQKQPSTSTSKHNNERDMAIYKPYFNFSMPFNRIPPHKVCESLSAPNYRHIYVNSLPIGRFTGISHKSWGG